MIILLKSDPPPYSPGKLINHRLGSTRWGSQHHPGLPTPHTLFHNQSISKLCRFYLPKLSWVCLLLSASLVQATVMANLGYWLVNQNLLLLPPHPNVFSPLRVEPSFWTWSLCHLLVFNPLMTPIDLKRKSKLLCELDTLRWTAPSSPRSPLSPPFPSFPPFQMHPLVSISLPQPHASFSHRDLAVSSSQITPGVLGLGPWSLFTLPISAQESLSQGHLLWYPRQGQILSTGSPSTMDFSFRACTAVAKSCLFMW